MNYIKTGLSTLLSILAVMQGPGPALAADDAMEEIVVQGRAQKLYRVTETYTGKLATAPLESSQSIHVIDAALITDQGARNAQDLYRNISGVTLFSYAGVTARGFRQEGIFFDGLRGDPYAGFSVPELFNVQRLEFLKGPAGMLYGAGAPGGIFNYVTKKPSEELSLHAKAIAGTGNRFGGSAEATGALVDDVVSGRVGLYYEDRDLPRHNAGNESFIADAGLAFNLGRSKLTVQATHYEQDLAANRLRGVPVDDDGNFIADREWNHNEPGDFLRLKSTTLSARLDTEVTESLTLDAALRYNPSTERQKYHEPRGLIDTTGDGNVDTTTREYRDQTRELEKWSMAANAVWSAESGGLSNRLLFGGDYYTEDYTFNASTARGASVPTLSLLNPVYGLADPATYAHVVRPETRLGGDRKGVYLLEEATLGDFILTTGLRYDSYRDDNKVNGVSFTNDAVTFRAGLVYRVTEDISLYGQWADSFEPQSLGSQDVRAGGPFDPTRGDMYEAGVKTALFDGRVQTSLVAYRIKRSNILQADPRGDVDGDGVDDSIAFGEIVSKGVELDLAADLTDDWVLTLTYGYNDTRLTKDNGLTTIGWSVGDRFPNAPEHQMGFWTRYQLPSLGLAVAFGGDYVGERFSLSNQKVQAYMIFDASVTYDLGDWNLLLRVDNLFDKTYAESGFIDRTGHFPGEPRSAFAELSYKW